MPLTAIPASAHEIPGEVTVRAYVAPDGERLTVLLRLPLEAMRDIEFPTRGPGYLDLERIDRQLEDAIRLWVLDDLKIYEDDVLLVPVAIKAVRLSLPGDRAFDSFAGASQAIASRPLPSDTEIFWEQALLDAAVVYPIRSDAADFDIEPSFARLGLSTLTWLEFHPPEDEPRVMVVKGNPGRMSLDPGIVEVLGRFLRDGFEHVLDGLDHLLFLLVLVAPLRALRPLVVVVTAFTLAHSMTLAAAALHLVPTGLWFPPLIELLIAASILYMALENLLAPSLDRRWLAAFGFGLIHGFGFSYALEDSLQFAGDHVLVSLAGFNAGIEIGQLLVIGVLALLLRLMGSRVPAAVITIVLTVFVAHTAWHWLVERWEVFSQFQPALPPADVVLLVGLMRWLMLALCVAFVVWLVRPPLTRWARSTADRNTSGQDLGQAIRDRLR